jgi:hypothetical protein
MGKQGDLSLEMKWAIISRYLYYCPKDSTKIASGCLPIVVKELNISDRSIRRVMTQYFQMCKDQGTMCPDMSDTIKTRIGQASQLTEELKTEIKRINEETLGRLTILEFSNRLEISKSSMHRYLRQMYANKVSTWVKPKLSFHQQMERLRFVLNVRRGDSSQFKNQKNVVMVDESWFYLHKTKGYVRLFPGDEMPDPVQVKHKSHIPKVMFLTAVARPCPERGFDGKIGIFRVCKRKAAKRKSRYHDAGDVFLHDCTMNAELYRQFMMVIFELIKARMPWMAGKTVIVQQDGASPHVGKGNLEYFRQEGRKNGWKIKVVTQPPQSPDLNVNDLGFFRSLKCRVEILKNGANNLSDLYQSVEEAWNRHDGATLDFFR